MNTDQEIEKVGKAVLDAAFKVPAALRTRDCCKPVYEAALTIELLRSADTCKLSAKNQFLWFMMANVSTWHFAPISS